MSALGARGPRLDAEPKVLGATRFAADDAEPGLLHARLVLSQEAHARIADVDTSAALEVEGVVRVLLARDLPITGSGETRQYEPLARDTVLFAGQPVAIVVAESEAAAEDGVEAVVAEYAPLPAVVDIDAALDKDSPRARPRAAADEGDDLAAAHTAAGGGEQVEAEDLSENVVSSRRYHDGDLAAALAASDAVVEARFETPWNYQAYVEPQTATARMDADGTLVVTTSTQGAFHTRAELSKLLGLPRARIRVVAAPPGGAFGGKLMLVEPLAAAAALAVGSPVRLAFTRTEDFLAGQPNPGGFVELKAGATREGDLTGLEARVVYERGAFHDWGIESIVALLIGGVYRWRAHEVRAHGVETNRPGFGAYRAPGAPPAAFAIESALDELASELGLDPLEFRARNLVVAGDKRVDGKPWPAIGAAECLERLRDHPLWQARAGLPDGEGVGLAVGVWPGASSQASATCRLDDDGGLTIVTGAVDMSGVASGFAVIAAEIFGLPADRVRVVGSDTATAPRAPISGGSQVTYSVGRAVESAAIAARQKLFAIAGKELEVDPADLEIVDGLVRPKGAPAQGLPVEQLAEKALSGRYAPVEATGGSASVGLAPSVAAHLAHVRVDRETGETHVLAWVVAQDVGRALNPDLCEGQMRGGVAQGIGWALYEELVVDEEGQALTASFMDYALPSAERVPPIETIIVEVPAPNGPLGAKGIGEAPVVACAAAVANAVDAAAGVRMRRLPMTAPRVWAALQG